MTVSLLEIFAAARAHAAPLAAESAGYLLLAVADSVVSAPRATKAEEVELLPDGSVRLRGRGVACDDRGAERSVRVLLSRALEVSSSVGPALRRAAQRPDDAGLSTLVRELETALIPVNRAAAKRALSRLHRETERARDAGKLASWLAAEQASVAAAVLEVPSEPAPNAEPLLAPQPPQAEVPVLAADCAEPSPVALPAVVALPVSAADLVAAPAAVPPAVPGSAEHTPEPLLAVGEVAFTKPEPVVQRAKERGSRTPRLGTLVTALSLTGDDAELTERAPEVELEGEAEELELPIEVELLVEASAPADVRVADTSQPLSDPEPSRMPDVLTAMLELHTGLDADEAPTRLRGVVTSVSLTPAPDPVSLTPEPDQVSLRPEPEQVSLTPEPEQQVDDAWLTQSSLEDVVSAPRIFVSERSEPAVHDALTWNPGPVELEPAPPAVTIGEPLPELSPYAPAVLPARTSDVSELLDSFYVSGGAEERELRSALKEMAELSLTPLPHPLVQER